MLPSNIESPEEVLREAGKRVTSQRLLVLEIITESNHHLTAEDIYGLAKERDSNISLATVYRNLQVLQELDLIEHRYFAREHGKEQYEATGAPEHYHFTCRVCGQVIEFGTPLMAQLREDLRERFGWQLDRSCMCLEGVCAECADHSNPATSVLPIPELIPISP